jgi:DsbC/DsbD-like thiol-disulfide interchange protein
MFGCSCANKWLASIAAAVAAACSMGIYGCRPAAVPAESVASPDATAPTPIDVPTLVSAADSEPTVNDDDVPIGSPTADTPIVVAAAVLPQQARPGETVTLVVRVRMGIGWHIYALGQKTPSAPFAPTTIDFALPRGIEPVGQWLVPPPEHFRGQTGPGLVYQGEVVVRRKLRIANQLPSGKLELPCTIRYQACRAELCLRPTQVVLRPVVNVVASRNE